MKRLIPILFVACGNDAGAGAPVVVDAPEVSVTMTECKVHKSVVTEGNGERSESWTYFVAIVATPRDEFSAVLCGFVGANAACPPGAICTDSGDPLPTGARCAVSTAATSTFWGGMAVADCGHETVKFDRTGAEIERSGQHYTTVEIRQ